MRELADELESAYSVRDPRSCLVAVDGKPDSFSKARAYSTISLGGGEGAMPAPVDVGLAEVGWIAVAADLAGVPVLGLGAHCAVAGAMHGEYRDVGCTCWRAVVAEPPGGVRLGLDARRGGQALQVGVEAEAGVTVSLLDQAALAGISELPLVVHSGIPGRVAARPRLQDGPAGGSGQWFEGNEVELGLLYYLVFDGGGGGGRAARYEPGTSATALASASRARPAGVARAS